MGRIQKTVFISYRRTNFYTALAVYQDLTAHGYDVFFDYQSIDSGNFSNVILENIESHAHFVVVLSPSALERCNQPGDWLRREIETAIELKRNIVPLMMEGFDFGSPTTIQALSGNLATLNTYNGLRLYADYFFDAMEKLRTRFLSVALEDIRSREVSGEAREANESRKTLADEAPQVESQQLTAEEWFERAYALQEAKNFDEAIRCYTEALRLEPDLDSAHNNLGVLLRDLKRNDEAEAAYRKVIELSEASPSGGNPAYATAYYNLGVLLRDLKRNDEAEAAYRKAIEINPALTEAHYNLGAFLSDLKRNDEAEAAYRKAIEINPDDDTVYSNLGLLLSDLKRNDEAEAAYRKAIDLNPALTEAYSNLGNLLRNLKRNDEAEAAYRKAIDLNPAYAKAYYNLGLLLRDLKRNDEAEAAYRKAIELSEASPSGGNPAYETAYVNLTQLYFDQGKQREAITVLTEAIRLNPENARYYQQRGLFHQTMENLESALDDYRQAIKLQPDYGLVRMSLFGLLKKMGKDEEASEHEPLAREFAKTESEYNRACFESLCGNIEEALNLLKIAFEKGESSKEWAQQDPDLENIRNDPRFKELVGEESKR